VSTPVWLGWGKLKQARAIINQAFMYALNLQRGEREKKIT